MPVGKPAPPGRVKTTITVSAAFAERLRTICNVRRLTMAQALVHYGGSIEKEYLKVLGELKRHALANGA